MKISASRKNIVLEAVKYLCHIFILGIFILPFFLLKSGIDSGLQAKLYLKNAGYTAAGITNSTFYRDNYYRFYAKSMTFYQSKSGENLIDEFEATLLQELSDVKYTDISPINPKNLTSGSLSKLKGNEAAVSSGLSLKVGDKFYIRNGVEIVELRVKYVFSECYGFVDLSPKNTGGIVLSSDIKLSTKNVPFIEFFDNSSNSYHEIYLKSKELQRVGVIYVAYIVLSYILSFVPAMGIYHVLNRRAKNCFIKRRSLGASRLNSIIMYLKSFLIFVVPFFIAAMVIIALLKAETIHYFILSLAFLSILITLIANLFITHKKEHD